MGMIDHLEKMLAGGQDNALLRFGLGNAYLKIGEPDIAVTHLRAAVNYDPGYSAAWKSLGKALTEAEQADEARAAYEKGIQVAEGKGDIQAAREMRVFLKRLHMSPGTQ